MRSLFLFLLCLFALFLVSCEGEEENHSKCFNGDAHCVAHNSGLSYDVRSIETTANLVQIELFKESIFSESSEPRMIRSDAFDLACNLLDKSFNNHRMSFHFLVGGTDQFGNEIEIEAAHVVFDAEILSKINCENRGVLELDNLATVDWHPDFR